MASVQLKKEYTGIFDTDVYDAALKAIPNAGYEVWKTRELAKLVMGKAQVDGVEVRCNIVVSMVDSSATITAESDDIPEEGLEPVAEKLGEELDKLLK